MDAIKTIYLSIAGFNIRVNLKPTEWKLTLQLKEQEINKYWSGFIVKNPKKIDYIINLVEETHIKTIDKIKEKTRYIVFYIKNTDRTLTVNYLISVFHFQILLRQIVNDLLSQHNGLILHASSNLINNKASIFLAPSGGGKSTMMKILSKKYQPLGDDTVIIKKEYKQYFVYQSPMIEKESWIKKGNKRYQLDKIYLLNKSSDYLIKNITDNKIKLDKIFQQFWSDKNTYSKQVKNIIGLTQNIHFYDIFFGINSGKLITLINKHD